MTKLTLSAASYMAVATLSIMALSEPASAQNLKQLPPGAEYRYIFTTAGQHDASSSNISVYNSFVQSQAEQNSALAGVTFKAIGSTSTVDAINNVSCGSGCDSLPIYTLDGQLVADNLADFFSGTLKSTIAVNQFGGSNNTYVFTGSSANGAQSSRPLGGAYADLGENFFTSQYYINSGSYGNSYQGFDFYGLSDAVGAPVSAAPEPSAWLLMILGVGVSGAALRARRAQIKAGVSTIA